MSFNSNDKNVKRNVKKPKKLDDEDSIQNKL